MIQAQTIVTLCNAELDAEGSERYLWELDFRPMINNAKEWIVGLFNMAFAQNKLSEESLRELTRSGVWAASSLSRISIDSNDIGHDLWTIIGVYPQCGYSPITPVISANTTTTSIYYGSKIMLIGNHSAKRATFEEIAQSRTNVFAAGSGYFTCDDLLSYAYTNFMLYKNGQSIENSEIEIFPSISGQQCGIAYLKYPNNVTNITDYLEFPSSLTNMIVQKVLNLIAIKEGEQTLRLNTEQELSQLLQAMS